MSTSAFIKMCVGGVIGTAGIYYLTEYYRKSNHDMLKNTYRQSFEANKERMEANAKALRGTAKENPSKS